MLETWGSKGKVGPYVVLTGQVRFPLNDHYQELNSRLEGDIEEEDEETTMHMLPAHLYHFNKVTVFLSPRRKGGTVSGLDRTSALSLEGPRPRACCDLSGVGCRVAGVGCRV